ncbi:MAG: response regulator [Proteobacteria bacterium]|nr:response regulator [Pseudomonadota bacterium]
MPRSNLLAGLDILLIEDETMVSFLIEEMLEQLGAASVRHAARLDAGLALVAAKLPALAILDVNIGGETAFPIAEKLETSGIPFVFITGYGRDGVHGRWAAHEVLQKPLTVAEFEQGLRRVIGH